jgi:putative membrane protein
VGRGAAQGLSPLAGIGYLVAACFACTLLGIYITFAPASVCPAYMHPADPYGLLPVIQDQWGLTARMDQQIGGLLMWVPACLIYLSGVMGLLSRWYTPAPNVAISNQHLT